MISFINIHAKTPGGFQSLILNLAKELNKKGEKIKLFSKSESYVYIQLVKNNLCFEYIDLDNVEKKNIYKFVNNNDVFIITNYLFDLKYLVKANPKIVFWNIFPSTLITFNNFKRYHSKFLNKKIIKCLLESNALFFMDNNGVVEIENHYSFKIPQPIYIPIPIEYIKNKYLDRVQNNAQFNITYIGRAVIWKIHPLLKIINDLKSISNIKLIIITDSKNMLQEYVSTKNINFTIDYYENFNRKELCEFLSKNCDLNIGMGTSCLESSTLGIPSLLIDASYVPIPDDYKYKWIFENENYSLGSILNKTTLVYGGYTLNDVVNKLIGSLEYREVISSQCYNYTRENHSIETVLNKLLFDINKSHLKLKNIYNYFIKSYRLYYFIDFLINLTKWKRLKRK